MVGHCSSMFGQKHQRTSRYPVEVESAAHSARCIVMANADFFPFCPQYWFWQEASTLAGPTSLLCYSKSPRFHCGVLQAPPLPTKLFMRALVELPHTQMATGGDDHFPQKYDERFSAISRHFVGKELKINRRRFSRDYRRQ